MKDLIKVSDQGENCQCSMTFLRCRIDWKTTFNRLCRRCQSFFRCEKRWWRDRNELFLALPGWWCLGGSILDKRQDIDDSVLRQGQCPPAFLREPQVNRHRTYFNNLRNRRRGQRFGFERSFYGTERYLFETDVFRQCRLFQSTEFFSSVHFISIIDKTRQGLTMI